MRAHNKEVRKRHVDLDRMLTTYRAKMDNRGRPS